MTDTGEHTQIVVPPIIENPNHLINPINSIKAINSQPPKHETKTNVPSSSANQSWKLNNDYANKQLPFISSNIDQFMQPQSREHKISTSSNENEPQFECEPYSRRDKKPESNNDSEGFESPNFSLPKTVTPNQTSSSRVLSPDSSDYEKYECKTSFIQNRETQSSSPADSQSARTHRKSVSFDLDVEEFKRVEDEPENYSDSPRLGEEKRQIKGILRTPSPSVHSPYPGFLGEMEKRYVDDDSQPEMIEIEHENPFRNAYLSQESFIHESAHSGRSRPSKIPIKKNIFTPPALTDLRQSGRMPPPPLPPKPVLKKADIVKNESLDQFQQERGDFVEYIHDAKTNTILEVKKDDFSPDGPLPPLPMNSPPPIPPSIPVYRRLNSAERPKESPPPPPTPKLTEEFTRIEMIPATYEILPSKQKARFVHENSTDNILVTEDVHREILLQENEIRKAIISTEYDEYSLSSQEMLTNFSSSSHLPDDSSSILSCSIRSASPMQEPILPPAQVLPVHYTQLPKPQSPGYMQLVPSHIPVALCTSRKQDAQEYHMVSGAGQRISNNLNNPPLIIVGQPEIVEYRIARKAPPPPTLTPSPPPPPLPLTAPPSLPASSPPLSTSSSSAHEIIYANIEHVQEHQYYHRSVQSFGEISPIRVNQPITHFVYSNASNSNSNTKTDTVTTQSDPNYPMSSFGKKQTSV